MKKTLLKITLGIICFLGLTQAQAQNKVLFTNVVATQYTTNSVKIDYDLDWNGITPSNIYVRYGLDGSLQVQNSTDFVVTPVPQVNGSYSTIVTGSLRGLDPNNLYYFQLKASPNLVLGDDGTSARSTFYLITTLPTIAFSSFASSDVTSSSLHFKWSLVSRGNTTVTLRYATDYELTQNVQTITNPSWNFPTGTSSYTEQDYLAENLNPFTVYYYQVSATNPVGTTSTETYQIFTPSPSPVVSNMVITPSTTAAVVNFDLNAYQEGVSPMVQIANDIYFTSGFKGSGGSIVGQNPLNYVTGIQSLSVDFTPFIQLTPNTNYYLRVVMNGFNGATYSQVYPFKTTTVTGIENQSASQFTVYPNPAKDIVHVSGFSEILTLNGNKVAGGTETIDVSGLASGVYIVKTGSTTSKLIKE